MIDKIVLAMIQAVVDASRSGNPESAKDDLARLAALAKDPNQQKIVNDKIRRVSEQHNLSLVGQIAYMDPLASIMQWVMKHVDPILAAISFEAAQIFSSGGVYSAERAVLIAESLYRKYHRPLQNILAESKVAGNIKGVADLIGTVVVDELSEPQQKAIRALNTAMRNGRNKWEVRPENVPVLSVASSSDVPLNPWTKPIADMFPVGAPPPPPSDGLVASGQDDEPDGDYIIYPELDAAVASVQRRIPMTNDQFNSIVDMEREDAFTVGKGVTNEAVRHIRDAIAEAVAEGLDVHDVRKKLDLAGVVVDRKHLETIYRNNVQEAYTRGKLKVLEDSYVASQFPYIIYQATHDRRVRPEHLAMETLGLDGTSVYRSDDPVIQKFLPPWGHNCRCNWVPASVEVAAMMGCREAMEWQATGVPPAMPEYVVHPPFDLPPGWGVRRLSLDAKPSVEMMRLYIVIAMLDEAMARAANIHRFGPRNYKGLTGANNTIKKLAELWKNPDLFFGQKNLGWVAFTSSTGSVAAVNPNTGTKAYGEKAKQLLAGGRASPVVKGRSHEVVNRHMESQVDWSEEVVDEIVGHLGKMTRNQLEHARSLAVAQSKASGYIRAGLVQSIREWAREAAVGNQDEADDAKKSQTRIDKAVQEILGPYQGGENFDDIDPSKPHRIPFFPGDLTPQQKIEVFRSMSDAYAVAGLKKDRLVGHDRDGNPIMDYTEHREYLIVDDVKGRKIRYFVVLPDNRKAYPKDVFPSLNHDVIHAVMDAKNKLLDKVAKLAKGDE